MKCLLYFNKNVGETFGDLEAASKVVLNATKVAEKLLFVLKLL